jgi:hypothetical protein
MKMTVAELAAKLDMPYHEVCGFVKVAKHLGKATEADKVKPKNGKGKSSTVYEFDEDVVSFITKHS